MYANILLSTDGSDVARKGVEHEIALAKALNAKVTVITVTDPLPSEEARSPGTVTSLLRPALAEISCAAFSLTLVSRVTWRRLSPYLRMRLPTTRGVRDAIAGKGTRQVTKKSGVDSPKQLSTGRGSG
jgi:nucleotide-binding universal stress UspA family protein